MMRFLHLAKPALIGLMALCLSACNTVEDLANEALREVEKMVVEQVENLINSSLELLNQQLDKAQNETREWLDQEPPEEQKTPQDQPEVAPQDVLMPGPGQHEA